MDNMETVTTEVETVTAEVETVEEKAYTLRPLVATDTGAVCKVISAIGFRQLKDCFNLSDLTEQKKTVDQFGFDVAFNIAGVVFDNMQNAETAINNLLSSLTGMKVADIRKMPFADYGEMVMEVVMKEEFRDFFMRAMKLFNR